MKGCSTTTAKRVMATGLARRPTCHRSRVRAGFPDGRRGSMVFFGSLLGALIVIAWIAAFVDIARHRHERTFAATSAWILVVLILPVVGTLTYFIVTRMQSALNDDDGPGGAE